VSWGVTDVPPPSPPSWAALPPPGATTAQGLARRLGAYCWAEQQLFALLGGWVVEVGEPDAKLVVAEHAEHAAWRAQRWFELLPTAAPGADALVVPPAGAEGAWAAAHDVADGNDRTAEKLAVVHRALVPALLGAYTGHLDWASSVAEAGVRRALTVAWRDLTTDLTTGERLLQAVAADGGVRARVRAAAATVDDLVATAGGVIGAHSVGLRPV
jgi:hypothetical protein